MGKLKLSVPKNLSDINLEQVQSVLMLDKREDLSELAKKVHSVAILCSASSMAVATLLPDELDKIYERLFAMINGSVSCPLRRHVNYLGRDYGFIEDVRDMETGAFVDIDQMCTKDGYAENLHKIMAVLYRPIDAKFGRNYRLKSYVKEDQGERQERQLIFLKNMTLEEVRGATGFFLRVIQKSLNISDDSFPVVPELTLERVIRGAGITSFTQLVDESSANSKQSLNQELVKR